MINWTISQTVELRNPLKQNHINYGAALMLEGDSNAHVWQVTVLDKGKAADLSGCTLTGYMHRSDGETVVIPNGTISGNVCSIPFSAACYAVEGAVRGIVRLVTSTATVTLATGAFNVRHGKGDSLVIDPGTPMPSYEQLIAKVEAAEAGLAVERARINAFTELASGSTTGDAELIDGRIDDNGVKWGNIGNHVRSVGNMNTLLAGAAMFTVEKISTTIINGWVDNTGSYISNASSGDAHKCIQIDVIPGEHYLIYSEYGWSMPDAVAQKADGGLVNIFHTSSAHAVNDFDQIITIPDGAAKLTVNCMSGNVKPLAVAKIVGCTGQITPEYITSALSAMKHERVLYGANLITATKTAYSLKFGEEFVVESGDKQFSVGECAVKQGRAYHIVAGASFMGNPYIFYDENGLIIGELLMAPESGYQTYDLEITAPPRAAMLKVGHHGNIKPEVHEITGYATAKEWSKLKWVCMGDSLTEENSRATLRYYDYIADATGITAVNMGVGGTGYKRGEDNAKAFYQRAENVPADADIVTIFGSGNDLSLIGNLGSPTDTGTDTICGCINLTIDALYAIKPTMRIGIISPTPWINNQPNDKGSMTLYVEAMKEICALQGIPFLDLFHCSGFRPNDAAYRSAVFSKDDGNGVHPDENGHAIIAPRIKAFLETLIL